MAPIVKNNSLSVFAGQITGVFGLVGAGRTETFKIVAGVLKRDFVHGGEIFLGERPVRFRVPASAVRAGVAYVTEDRKVEGFFETMSIARNIYLGLLAKFPNGRFLTSRTEADKTGESWISQLNVRTIGKGVKVVELSGQPAESGDRQIAGAGAEPDHFRRTDPRRRRRRDRRNSRSDQSPGRRRQGCRRDLLLSARDSRSPTASWFADKARLSRNSRRWT